MSDISEPNRTPSVAEFGGWYNLGQAYEDGLPVLNAIEPLPQFHHAEFFELHFEAEQWFGALVEPRPNEPFDPLAAPPFFVRADADDRTLAVDADFDVLTPLVLHRVQKEFLGRHPLWRVIMVAEQPSCSIAIYPNAIRFGSLPLGIDPERALRELVPQQLLMRKARERPRRNHIAQMQQLLPDAVRAIGDRPFLVCGLLDNYEGDYSRLTLCILSRGIDDRAIHVERPAGKSEEFLWTSSPFGISAQGVITSYIEIPESTPYILVPWIAPADYRGPLTIVEWQTGKRHIYELKSEDIIRTSPF